MDTRRLAWASYWVVGGYLLVMTLGTTWVQGNPNGSTLAFILWGLTGVTFLFLASLADKPTNVANTVKDLLSDHGYEPHSELADHWVLFADADESPRQFIVRPHPDEPGYAQVKQGHLVDPWTFEDEGSWEVGYRIPASLLAAVR